VHSRSLWNRIAPVIPALLLLCVGAHQVWLAHTVQISPWKGGGFGMFASTDGGLSRHFRIYLRSTERHEEVTIRGSLVDLYMRAKTFPTEAMLLRLADEVAYSAQQQGLEVVEVRVELWRMTYDADSLLPVKSLLVETTVTYEHV